MGLGRLIAGLVSSVCVGAQAGQAEPRAVSIPFPFSCVFGSAFWHGSARARPKPRKFIRLELKKKLWRGGWLWPPCLWDMGVRVVRRCWPGPEDVNTGGPGVAELYYAAVFCVLLSGHLEVCTVFGYFILSSSHPLCSGCKGPILLISRS